MITIILKISALHTTLYNHCLDARGIEYLLVAAVWFPTIEFGSKQSSRITKNSIIAPALNDRGDGIADALHLLFRLHLPEVN